MRLLAEANVACCNAPLAFKIVADFLGVSIPGRERSVTVKKKGLEKKDWPKEKRWLCWLCSVTKCQQLRGMLGELDDIHVGEWIMEAGDDPHLCFIGDGATSELKVRIAAKQASQ